MLTRSRTTVVALAVAALVLHGGDHASAAPTLGGALPGSPPAPLFPLDNWWSADVSSAPVDPNSASYIQFINDCPDCCPDGVGLHPDFGGNVEPGSVETYGVPYAVVDGSQPKRSVIFFYWQQSDGVDHSTNTSFPFYPLPDEAISQPHWVEGGDPASTDLRSEQDRHLIVVDRDNHHLYELWNVWYDTVNNQWYAGSGAFFDLKSNARRPETWTSADAAGFAMLPGLVRYEEVYASDPSYEIPHAFRMTVRDTNGYVYPASHEAGDTLGALPMGARLRLKAGKDISGFPPEIRRIFRAMKKHGLLVADNGTDMYVTGTYDTRWDNDVLNPAFGALNACDFDVIQLGWRPPTTGGTTPLYRFFNVVTGAHFYTINEAEKNAVLATLPQYQFEGIAYYVFVGPAPQASPVYRFFNAVTGTHFYTISEAEKNAVLATLPQYHFESIAFYAHPGAVSGTSPVYRFFNAGTGTHFYTISEAEKNAVIATLPQYHFEGAAYFGYAIP